MTFNPSGHVPVGTGNQYPVTSYTPQTTVIATQQGQQARHVHVIAHQHVGAPGYSQVPLRNVPARQLPNTGTTTVVFNQRAYRR
ncbi:putative uncharacterized protein [Waddlia chondrophila 2032/99]|uniref:Uncharacterized protein n=2 Tax=Waddlia chondrophila TaxID=71667 RepID=D6YVS6_WADCW|nr:hypothetical protein [Waddlia chondrophila]ADI38237.1 hypothetical protein wcw_0871 [Waddlia chondrophila WSU 86-1044]CCB90399.1 putative uncharacterized protein [Waddlia chondrophila 2032/99]